MYQKGQEPTLAAYFFFYKYQWKVDIISTSTLHRVCVKANLVVSTHAPQCNGNVSYYSVIALRKVVSRRIEK